MASGSDRSSWSVANLNSPWHTGILVCFVAILSYCLIKLGAVLTIDPQGPWPLWLGNVFLASILLLVPRRIWPILMAAALAAFFLYDIQTGSTIRLSALFILYDTVEALTAAFRFVAGEGFQNASVLTEGFRGWVKRGYPVEPR